MSRSTDIRIVGLSSWTEEHNYRTPMKFGGRVVTNVVLRNVVIEVETRSGRRGRGFGSMPVGNVWAWPSQVLAADVTLQAMLQFGQRMVQVISTYRGQGHPLEITEDWATQYDEVASVVKAELALSEPMPKLAQLVAASPFEAALHDAYGRALNLNSYNTLSSEYVNADLSHFLSPEFKEQYLDAYTYRQPKAQMPLYHLVGALDPLTEDDLSERLHDGLPETLPEWIQANGLTHLKIKLNGDDLRWDVDRVLAIHRITADAQKARGCSQWYYSADFNERCESVEYVLEFMAKIKEKSPEAFERLQYLEQPTHRDLRRFPENRMHKAAAIKPVVIDESLVDYESLLLSRELGYSGVALKTCKGHSEALLMAAAAQKFDLFLCVQDLTCPGYSFLHSASLAARIPGVAAIEGNARQYCPSANRGWDQRYPTMFHITDGTVGTLALSGLGLGFEPLSWEQHPTS
ncbi:MAG: enolase C-terminal domain-like protein [Thermogutta sp.]